MDFAAKHIEFVMACYVVSATLLLIMTAAIVIRAKRQDRQLAHLEEARGNSKKKAK